MVIYSTFPKTHPNAKHFAYEPGFQYFSIGLYHISNHISVIDLELAQRRKVQKPDCGHVISTKFDFFYSGN